ncbi:3-phosphoglycerate kinase [Pseudomonas capsici]|uniref:3-phosphoglycerate kinase n=1 Tax=Pseudomonas capsici TaxID=2810614 RepID=A0ABT3BZF9_9PSED|nr:MULTISPECIES: 3-phosphoglycerate kinase [Pseudomonas]MBN6716803.1 3-phosphoglycerate kinase [Pseudomonas capsici]MBN6721818.1 3-phosphoglycerate kinase [Pseudomonas capsici]MBN6725928.1 3-phosphoglycerate kinase [Pseudomonas capsici]MBX8475819.1 3-phosphoglycerate kinase [Pseudomonas cichorii]MBX8607069.1 3-phosphoglycerate kinase [Pseudomonas cichorii]
MNRLCCVLLAMLPLSAFAYPIEVEKHYQGVQIDYNSHDTYHDTGSITVNNYGSVDAKCSVVFRNGPEAPRTRRVQVAAGKSVDVSSKFNRSIIKLRITLNCEPA